MYDRDPTTIAKQCSMSATLNGLLNLTEGSRQIERTDLERIAYGDVLDTRRGMPTNVRDENIGRRLRIASIRREPRMVTSFR